MNITSKEESEALYNSQCCFLPKGSSLMLSLQKKKNRKKERENKQVKNKDKQK